MRATPIGGGSVRAVCEHTFAMTLRDEITALLEQGVRSAEIARRLGVANATVGYHLKRLSTPAPAYEANSAEAGPEARDGVRTRETFES